MLVLLLQVALYDKCFIVKKNTTTCTVMLDLITSKDENDFGCVVQKRLSTKDDYS